MKHFFLHLSLNIFVLIGHFLLTLGKILENHENNVAGDEPAFHECDYDEYDWIFNYRQAWPNILNISIFIKYFNFSNI